MARIYSTSWRVLIWLGTEDKDSNLALRFMSFVGAEWMKGNCRSERHHRYHDNRRELEAIRNLCRRSYWQRLWIIQEVLVARNAIVQCGHEVLKWEDFTKFKDHFTFSGLKTPRDDNFNDLHGTLASSLERYRNRYQLGLCSLRSLLLEFSTSKCSDERDMIYGLVGLANDASSLCIDYTKSAFDVFADVILLEKYKDCNTVIAFSQFLQRLLQGKAKLTRPSYSSLLPTPLATALGYNKGIVTRLGPCLEGERLCFNPPSYWMFKFLGTWLSFVYGDLQPLFSDGMEPHISSAVIPISSKFSHALIGRIPPEQSTTHIQPRRACSRLKGRSFES